MDRVQRMVIGMLEPGRGERYQLSPSNLPAIQREIAAVLTRGDAKSEMSALLRLIAALGGRLESPLVAGSLIRLLRGIPLAMAYIHEELSPSRQRRLQSLVRGVATVSARPGPPPLPVSPPRPGSAERRRAWSAVETEILEVDATRPDLGAAARLPSR